LIVRQVARITDDPGYRRLSPTLSENSPAAKPVPQYSSDSPTKNPFV
jgi:hypothetical protein